MIGGNSLVIWKRLSNRITKTGRKERPEALQASSKRPWNILICKCGPTRAVSTILIGQLPCPAAKMRVSIREPTGNLRFSRRNHGIGLVYTLGLVFFIAANERKWLPWTAHTLPVYPSRPPFWQAAIPQPDRRPVTNVSSYTNLTVIRSIPTGQRDTLTGITVDPTPNPLASNTYVRFTSQSTHIPDHDSPSFPGGERKRTKTFGFDGVRPFDRRDF